MSILFEKYGITPDQLNQRYWVGKESMNQIALSMHVCPDLLTKRAKEDGVKIKTHQEAMQDASLLGISRKNAVNQYYFDKLNSEVAWVLGIIASDGYVHTHGKAWGISSVDTDMLKQIAVLIDASEDRVIKRSTSNGWDLVIQSTYMVKALNRFGIYPNKSLNLEYLPIPEKLDNSFIRGYFDGDGWISTQKTQHTTNFVKGQVGLTTGSREFANALINILHSKDINARLRTRERGNYTFPSGITSNRHETHTVRLAGYSVALFYDYIYGDSMKETRLKRKYDKYTDWHNIYGILYDGKRLNQTPTKALRLNENGEVLNV